MTEPWIPTASPSPALPAGPGNRPRALLLPGRPGPAAARAACPAPGASCGQPGPGPGPGGVRPALPLAHRPGRGPGQGRPAAAALEGAGLRLRGDRHGDAPAPARQPQAAGVPAAGGGPDPQPHGLQFRGRGRWWPGACATAPRGLVVGGNIGKNKATPEEARPGRLRRRLPGHRPAGGLRGPEHLLAQHPRPAPAAGAGGAASPCWRACWRCARRWGWSASPCW